MPACGLCRLVKQVQDARWANDQAAAAVGLAQYEAALESFVPGKLVGGWRPHVGCVYDCALVCTAQRAQPQVAFGTAFKLLVRGAAHLQC